MHIYSVTLYGDYRLEGKRQDLIPRIVISHTFEDVLSHASPTKFTLVVNIYFCFLWLQLMRIPQRFQRVLAHAVSHL